MSSVSLFLKAVYSIKFKSLRSVSPSGWQGDRQRSMSCLNIMHLTDHTKTLSKITWRSAMDNPVHDAEI